MSKVAYLDAILKPQLAQIYSGWVLLTVLLNIIITLLISFRLIRLRNHLSKLFSQSQSQSAPRSQSWTESNRNNSNSGDPYLGVVALIVESAMPLSLIGIPLAALNFVNNPRANLASAILNRLFSAFMAFSPQMIIFRVTIGKSWVHRVEEKTANPGSVMSMPLAFGVKDDSESKGDMDLEYDLDTSKQTNSVS